MRVSVQGYNTMEGIDDVGQRFGGTPTPVRLRDSLIDLLVGPDGLQQDRFFAFQLDEGEHKSQVVACTARPQVCQGALQLVGAQSRMEGIFG